MLWLFYLWLHIFQYSIEKKRARMLVCNNKNIPIELAKTSHVQRVQKPLKTLERSEELLVLIKVQKLLKRLERTEELLVLIFYGRNGSELAYVHLNLVHTIWEIVLEGPVIWDHFFVNFTFLHFPVWCQRSVQNLSQASGLYSFKEAVINYDLDGGGHFRKFSENFQTPTYPAYQGWNPSNI